MSDLLIGAVTMAGFLLLVNYVRERELKLAWGHWALVLLGFLYAVFVLEIIVSFLEEGSARAAVVMGCILGSVAIIWGVFLGRFVIARARRDDASKEEFRGGV